MKYITLIILAHLFIAPFAVSKDYDRQQSHTFLMKAEAHKKNNEFKKASEFYEKALREDPSYGLAWHWAGYFYLTNRDDPHLAVKYAQKAAALMEDNQWPLIVLGNAYRKLKQTDKALEAFEKIHAIYEKKNKKPNFWAYNKAIPYLKKMLEYNFDEASMFNAELHTQ